MSCPSMVLLKICHALVEGQHGDEGSCSQPVNHVSVLLSAHPIGTYTSALFVVSSRLTCLQCQRE